MIGPLGGRIMRRGLHFVRLGRLRHGYSGVVGKHKGRHGPLKLEPRGPGELITHREIKMWGNQPLVYMFYRHILHAIPCRIHPKVHGRTLLLF